MNKIALGAPSLSGKDANDLVAKAFGKYDEWPLALNMTNVSARAVTFPEVQGLYLAPCTDADNCSKVVSVKDMDALQRLASSIEQVSELNGYETLIVIEEPEEMTMEDILAPDGEQGDAKEGIVEEKETESTAPQKAPAIKQPAKKSAVKK